MLCLFQINKNKERNQGRYYTIRDCHLIQTGVLFKLIKYPLFRFKCKSDIFNHKQLDWTHTIIINFEVNENLTQISAELW